MGDNVRLQLAASQKLATDAFSFQVSLEPTGPGGAFAESADY